MRDRERQNQVVGARGRILGVAFALIALLHLFRNGSQIADRELRLDEAWTYYVAAQPLVSNLTLPISLHAQPPLYYVALHALLSVHSAEWFLRGFSWLAILGLFGWILFRLTEIGPLARVFLCVVLLFHDVTRYLAQTLRPYALAAVTTFAATILFTRLLRRPGRGAAVAYAAAALLSLHTLAFDVWAFFCQGLALAAVVAWESRAGWRVALERHAAALLAVAGVALAYVPYLVLVWHWQSGIGRPDVSGSLDVILHADHLHELGVLLGGLPRWAVWLAIAALVYGVAAERRLGNSTALLIAVIAVGQVAFVQGFLYGRGPVADRYYTPVFPLFWFVVAIGFDHLIPRPPRLLWLASLAALGGAAWMLAPSFLENLARPIPRSPWRQVRDALIAMPGRKVVLFDYGFEAQMLEYEVRNDRDVVVKSRRQTSWKGYPEHIATESLRPEDVRAALDGERADCFLYFVGRALVDRGPGSPYFSAFVPEMDRRGYKRMPFLDSGHAFCKP
ncbi:MAG: hypothetical protein ACREQQ_07945 [Candidatus Binatia bacterium]